MQFIKQRKNTLTWNQNVSRFQLKIAYMKRLCPEADDFYI